MIDRETIHIHDLAAETERRISERALPEVSAFGPYLATPLLREGVSIGAILIRRTEVRPFSEKQIALLKTFADQAVIAIENVRLFKEFRSATRNCARRWSIRRQRPRCSASSAARRRTCSRSSTPSSRARRGFAGLMMWCCDSVRGTLWFRGLILVPYPLAASRSVLMSHSFAGCASMARFTFPTSARKTNFPGLGIRRQLPHLLGAPLRQQGELIGVLNARRTEVRPFTPAQIKLLETFADQAVIAIENVRFFKELKESLEQQTATSEILGVIASSPTDIQPVLDVVAENVVRVCGAEDALIWRLDGNSVRLAAINGLLPASEIGAERSLGPGTILGRAVRDRETVHIHDLAAAEAEFPECARLKDRCSHGVSNAIAPRRQSDWGNSHSPNEGPAFQRKANSAVENLRRSGGDCH